MKTTLPAASSPSAAAPAAPAAPATAPGRPGPLWRRARAAFRLEAKEFCLFTGLHGYKYIVQPNKHRVERLFWVLVVTVSMVAAVYLMQQAYTFNRNHPTILAVDTTHHALWRVDVPAVTVCPSNKVLRTKAMRLIHNMDLPPNVSPSELLEDMALLVELIAPRSDNNSRFQRLQSVLDRNNLNVDHVMKAVSPSCDELLVKCIWKRRQCLRCSDIFRMVRTAYGYCCSFNYMDRDLETHRPRMGGCVGVSYHRVQRVSACGYTNGLSVAVRVDPKDYLSSFLASYAVMVLIHNPWVYPDANADLKVVGVNTVSFISYLAQVTEASPRLRRMLPPKVRKCLFSDEGFMPMFRNYTYENCMASCRANDTLDVCHCVPFTYPYIMNRKICNLMDIPCLTSLTMPKTHQTLPNDTKCPLCHALCETVEYMVETSVGILNWEHIPDGDMLKHDLDRDEAEYAVFHVFANDLVTTKYKMDLFLTQEDLLGSLGGLSGLFVGFSLVSAFEFVYFFTIRPFFRMRARHTASQAASQSPSAASAGGHHFWNRSHPLPNDNPPFPLVAPHVFRLRRRASDKLSAQDKDVRPERATRRGAKGISMIPVIE